MSLYSSSETSGATAGYGILFDALADARRAIGLEVDGLRAISAALDGELWRGAAARSTRSAAPAAASS